MLDFLKGTPRNVEYYGFEHLTYSGPTIFMANHVSIHDIPLLDSKLPRDVYFAVHDELKEEYESLLQTRKHILYNTFDPKPFIRIRKRLQEGHAVLVFPEAKITTTGSFMKIYPEMAKVALETEATIFPIIIDGAANSEFFASPNIKIHLQKPFKMHPEKGNAQLQILEKFQNGLFQSRMKEDVNLFNELIDAAKIRGEKTVALEDMGRKMTYKDLLLACHAMSYRLTDMLGDQQRIGTFLPTSIGYALTLFTLFKIGKIPALLNFTMGEHTLIDCLETADLKTVITSKEFVEKGGFEDIIEAVSKKVKVIYLEDVRPLITNGDKIKAFSEYTTSRKVSPKNNEIILFTSGSENKPKGVILTHDNIYANINQLLCIIDFTIKDKMLNALPMFHSFGLTAGTILPLLAGIPVFLYPAPTHYKVIPELAYRTDATVMLGTSTFYSLYAKNADKFDFHKIRIAAAGAEKLKEDVYQTWNEKFGVRIIEGYGVTETTPVLSLNVPMLYTKGSVGRLLPGMEYKIEPVEGIKEGGTLLVKGPNVMKGYLIHKKGFIPNEGFYDTGDIVKVDDEGFLYIIGRKKRFAKIGGEMVSLHLIEDIATETYGSTEFAAVSVEDPKKGEQIILFTTVEGANLKEIKGLIKEKKYSALLVPKEIEILTELPLLGSGKIDYVSLEKQAKELHLKKESRSIFHS